MKINKHDPYKYHKRWGERNLYYGIIKIIIIIFGCIYLSNTPWFLTGIFLGILLIPFIYENFRTAYYAMRGKGV